MSRYFCKYLQVYALCINLYRFFMQIFEGDKMTLYDRLDELCVINNLSVNKLCKELKISTGNQNTWKKGNMHIEHLTKICDYLGCSVDYLLGRTPCPDINISGNTQNNINGDNNISVNNNDELAGELSSLLKSLNMRKRTELMTMIYHFVDTNKKE